MNRNLISEDVPVAGEGVKIGLLCNPLSGRVRKEKKSTVRIFSGTVGASYQEASSPAEIGTALNILLAEQPELLAIAGGDGTVQAALTHMFGSNEPSGWPPLCIIPAGTTNMTALDLGVRGRPKRVLNRLERRLYKPFSPYLVQRPVLRVERPGSPDLYGMFFGAGAIASGVRYFHEKISRIGMTSEIAGGLVLLWLLGGLLAGHSGNALSPARLSVTGPDGDRREGSYIILLASALDRLLLGMRPYWGREQAPIHATLVRESPRRFWRSLPPLLSGRGERLAGLDGYESFNTSVLELLMDDEFIIDGELHKAESSAGPLRISSAGPVTFFVP